MAMPNQGEIELPLLHALVNVGGSARPSELYDVIAAGFPDMTDEERQEELKKWGVNKFNNRVQFTRQSLKERGLLDAPARGIWRITVLAARHSSVMRQTP